MILMKFLSPMYYDNVYFYLKYLSTIEGLKVGMIFDADMPSTSWKDVRLGRALNIDPYPYKLSGTKTTTWIQTFTLGLPGPARESSSVMLTFSVIANHMSMFKL